MTLNAVQQAWVNALRSGKYQQTRRHLHDFAAEDGSTPEGWCCLGVACDLYAETHPAFLREVVNHGAGRFYETFGADGGGDYGGHSATLPVVVQQWLGLRTKAGEFSYGFGSLAMLNDRGEPFEEIAGVIEARADSLFQ